MREYAAQVSYTNDRAVDIPAGELLMDVVGYANANNSAATHPSQKADALQWCMDHHPFISSRAGTKLFVDRDPRMLTFVFPHLDPWGIGGFHNPLRQGRQCIGFERQFHNLLMQYDSPFEKDPNFAYVAWNIIQKSEVNANI
jgi:hypothetical protein